MTDRTTPATPARRRVLLWGGAAAGAAAAGSLGWRAAARQRPRPSGAITVSTGVASGVYTRYGELLRRQLARDLPELKVTLRASEGSVQNIARLVAGEADFTIATADAIAAYRRDGGPGAGRLRACARLYDDYLQLVVPVSSSVSSMRELAGLRVGVGQDQSGVQLVTRELLAAAGLDMERDIEAVREGIHVMPSLLEEGRLDAFVWSGGLPTQAVEELSGRMSVRLVPLAELLPALHARGAQHTHYRWGVVTPDAYPAISGTRVTESIAVANLLLTVVETDALLAEQLTASVIRGRDRIGAEVHAAQRVDVRSAIYTRPLELHEGARRYYRSVKS